MTTKQKLDDYQDLMLRHLAAVRDYPEAHRDISEPENPFKEPLHIHLYVRELADKIRRDFNRTF